MLWLTDVLHKATTNGFSLLFEAHALHPRVRDGIRCILSHGLIFCGGTAAENMRGLALARHRPYTSQCKHDAVHDMYKAMLETRTRIKHRRVVRAGWAWASSESC